MFVDEEKYICIHLVNGKFVSVGIFKENIY